MDNEIWRPVPGFEGRYDVSDQGRVRGWVNNYGNQRVEPKVLKPGKDTGGYMLFTLVRSKGAKKENWLGHRLVMLAFVGPMPEGMQTRHLDGDPWNNRLSNLAYGTGEENQADRVEHGTDHRGERQHFAKLTDTIVIQARIAAALGARHCDLARDHGVTQTTMMKAINGMTWGHLPKVSAHSSEELFGGVQ